MAATPARSRHAGIVLAVLSSAVLVACGGDSDTATTETATAPPQATAIPSLATPRIGVFVVQSDGSALRQVWDQDVFLQTWSPDSTMLAFADREYPDHALTLLDVGSGASRPLGEIRDATIAWSPSGRELLVTAPPTADAPQEAPTVLDVLDVGTGQRRRVTESIGGEWSPDGSRIVVAGTSCEARFVRRIFDLATNTTADVLPQYVGASAFISPDWTRVAYFKTGTPFTPLEDNTLYVANVDGTDERALPTADIGRATPSWSPDSHWIAYSPRANGRYTPYVLDADGSRAAIQLADEGDATAWSPDSSMIVVQAQNGSGASAEPTNVIYELATGQTHNLPDGPVYHVEWSPTSRSVAFVAPASTSGNPTLFLYNLLDSTVVPVADESISVANPRWSPDGKQIAFLGIPGGYDYGPCL